MKKTIFLSFTLIIFYACEKPIQLPVDVLNANLEATSNGTDWSSFRGKKSVSEINTLIEGKSVAQNRVIVNTKQPNLQKKEIFTGDELVNIILTGENESWIVLFQKGEYVGMNAIPREPVALNPIIALMEKADDLTMKDTIYNSTATYILYREEPKEKYVFDKESKMLLAYITNNPYGESTTFYSDYREVNGLMFPFKEVLDIPASGYQVETVYSEIEVNPKFTDGFFEKDKSWNSLAAGQTIPDFEVPLLNSEKLLSNNNLTQRVTLIDFWATWCKPCINEFPNIKENYQKYKDKGFQVVSISIDEDLEKLRAYSDKNPFPWEYSAYTDNGFESDIVKKFQVLAIPKPVLIDSKGTIIAMDNDVREKNLAKILKKVLE
ncbi:TlpA disulfide reductase family protein [Ascidiimonas aurantiaca]|uniref:TlpA family protein disulfide reductase n=1 Tax=Ascidiimonas aurantiaca TaxID=1685432 RepID=UPI0030EE9356